MPYVVWSKVSIKNGDLSEQEKEDMIESINLLSTYLDKCRISWYEIKKGILFTISEDYFGPKYSILFNEKIQLNGLFCFEKMTRDPLSPSSGCSRFNFDSSIEEFKEIFGEEVYGKLIDLVKKLNERKDS